MIRIDNDIRTLETDVRTMRRELHQIPEIGLSEFKTSDYIKRKLEEFGIQRIEPCLETGLVAVIEGPHSGVKETVAFRADIDALPVAESHSCHFHSLHEGKMHACGHDGHMATLLAFAKYLNERRDTLQGRVVCVFQPAEEGPGGAELMIKEGLIEKYGIDKFVGLHIFPEFSEGMIACRKGPLMPRNGEVTIRIEGISAHGAQPQKGADAIVAAAAVVSALNTIISRNINPLEPALLTLGRIAGGEARNIIAKEVAVTGTLRAFSDEVYETLVEKIESISKGVAAGYGCGADVDYFHMYRVVNNDDGLVDALVRAVGEDAYEESPMQMISEDFSLFQSEVPGIFFYLGSRNDEKGYVYPLHSAEFQFDEKILLGGIQAFKGILEEIYRM